MLTQKDSIIDRFRLHLNSIGVDCNALEPGSVDMDNEFRQNVHGSTGTMNMCSFRVLSKNIDYINITERLEYDAGPKYYGRYSRSEHVADQVFSADRQAWKAGSARRIYGCQH